MKQGLEKFKTGEWIVEEVPPTIIRDNFVLVKNHYSLISTGTEGGTVKLGKMSLLGKARARPDQAMKVIQVAKTQGLMVAYNAAMRSLEMLLRSLRIVALWREVNIYRKLAKSIKV